MLRLEKPIEFSDIVQPIALANFPLRPEDNCSLSGWGGTAILKTVFLSNMKLDEEKEIYSIADGVEGDSGSPIICAKGQEYVAHAIAMRQLQKQTAFYVNAAMYYRNVDTRFQQSVKIGDRHDYPDIISRSNGQGPAILQLVDDIVFNAYVKPLPLETDQPVSFDHIGLFTVDWNEKRRFYFGTDLHDESAKNSAYPLRYLCLLAGKRSTGAPLIYCNEDRIENKCQLLGFGLETRIPDSTSEEEHFTIGQYVDWIREILDIIRVIYYLTYNKDYLKN
uniref:Peptidase S1 domain-containing protein n=1 Tax=Romanomermis culicivorax TaxID=13658 RepID=A0A915J382_ROMCU